MHPKSEKVYSLIAADDYAAAGALIRRLRKAGHEDCELLLYEAICAYENSDDIGSLRLLHDFLKQAPRHQKRSYAAFTAGVCLTNLGLYDDALRLLLLVPASYEGRDREIRELRATIKKAQAARKTAEAIRELLTKA